MGKISYKETEAFKCALEKLPDLPGYSASCETRSELDAIKAVNENREYKIMVVATDRIDNNYYRGTFTGTGNIIPDAFIYQ